MADKPADDLIEAIDDAAAAILSRANGTVTVEGGETITLKEQLAAFEAITKWAEMRSRINPKDGKGTSAFASIKHRYAGNGATRRRGTARANGAADPESGGDIDLGDAFDDPSAAGHA